MRDFLRILIFCLIVKPILMIVLGVNVYGRGCLPKNQPFILVANHNSHLDALVLMHLFPLSQLCHIRPVAAEDYFSRNKWVFELTKLVFNIIPIPRTNITKSNNPITRMSEAIDAGQSLIIFPEGSRGVPEEFSPFQTGVAHLIHRYPQLPVLPVYMKGLGRSLPKGEWLLVPFFCDVILGQPLQLGHLSKDEIRSRLETIIHQMADSANT